ncbi:MAG: cobyric acid synthase CobQ, partial [Planctomycetes bacterium]|nr:cobyric acid synthase CobQ [Planctomycetota bacterium]
GKAVQIFDGCVSERGNVLGTYIHGIFDNDGYRYRLIKHLKLKKGLESVDGTPLSSQKIKEEKYNTLADIVRGNIDMGMVYKILEMS